VSSERASSFAGKFKTLVGNARRLLLISGVAPTPANLAGLIATLPHDRRDADLGGDPAESLCVLLLSAFPCDELDPEQYLEFSALVRYFMETVPSLRPDGRWLLENAALGTLEALAA
jgi:hypothetical protein